MSGSTPDRSNSDLAVGIRIEGLHKAYKIYDKRFDFLKEAITGRPYHRDKHVLRGIDVTIHRGEVVGIIGRNGAGKSTLLKVLAGTLAPSAGRVEVKGRVSAILELGTGFNPAYSGRDNVVMSALMRGLTDAAINAKFDSIVAFSGLGEVIDEPFHTYSSGMQARLAFAAAIAVDADVLIIDEALAAGDIRFAARSISRIHEICASGVTALFVSHVSYHVMQLCTRAIWIDDGRIRMDGAPVDVVRAYEYEMHETIARDRGRMVDSVQRVAARADGVVDVARSTGAPKADVTSTPAELAGSQAERIDDPPVALPSAPPYPTRAPGADVAAEAVGAAQIKADHFSTDQYRITSLDFVAADGTKTQSVKHGQPLTIRVAYECLLADVPSFSCGLAVAFNRLSDFEAVMYLNTNYPHSDEEIRQYTSATYRQYVGRSGVIEAVIPALQLRAGQYYVSLGILPNRPGPHEFYEYRHCQYVFTVLANGFDEPSVFYPFVEWKHGPLATESSRTH